MGVRITRISVTYESTNDKWFINQKEGQHEFGIKVSQIYWYIFLLFLPENFASLLLILFGSYTKLQIQSGMLFLKWVYLTYLRNGAATLLWSTLRCPDLTDYQQKQAGAVATASAADLLTKHSLPLLHVRFFTFHNEISVLCAAPSSDRNEQRTDHKNP